MATDGKKKSDDREPGAKKRKVRSSKSASNKAKAKKRTEDSATNDSSREPDAHRTAEQADQPEGLVVPSNNLIGPGGVLAASVGESSEQPDEGGAEDDTSPAELGATKYVHAAFFAAGILVAYLSGKLLALIWAQLADWEAAVHVVPQLLSVGEDRRGTYTMLVGVLIGVLAVVLTYQKPKIRRWADDVASELSKVTWPDKETVTNGTIVVIVGSAVATTYVALLDRVWMFVTSLIYGS